MVCTTCKQLCLICNAGPFALHADSYLLAMTFVPKTVDMLYATWLVRIYGHPKTTTGARYCSLGLPNKAAIAIQAFFTTLNFRQLTIVYTSMNSSLRYI